jgi:CRISPR/Cas system CMR subunit Cmr4 (Cas7 group RAMP superfamily)
MTSQWLNARGLSEIYIFTARLELSSPAIFGSGEKDGFTDISILRDLNTDKPLLSGSSLAGVIRNHLKQKGGSASADILFGSVGIDNDSEKNKVSKQSYVIFDESVAEGADNVEIRDGVSIEPQSRIADDGQKFDYEIVSKGTVFPISIELLVPKNETTAKKVKTAFLVCLKSLLNEEIQIGAKTTRGFGFCKFKDWKYRQFDMKTQDGILSWIQYGTDLDKLSPKSLQEFFEHWEEILPEASKVAGGLHLKACFTLKGSLLIRSDEGLPPGEDGTPDAAPLKRKSPESSDDREPIISGTSLAGVLRHRARKILITQGLSENNADEKIGNLFGQAGDDEEQKSNKKENKKPKKKSRLIVKECVVENAQGSEYVQSRVAIDRFTGGAAENKLFSEQAIFKAPGQKVCIELLVKEPTDDDFDLLLHLLKDLWYADLPIGSGASIGRGLLQGLWAEVKYNGDVWKTGPVIPDGTSEVPLILNKELSNDEK